MLNITTYCLADNYRQHPEKPALIYVPELGREEVLTYHDLYTAVAQLTQGILSLELPPGTCITLHSAKTLDFVILFFAAMAAGLIVIPALAALTQIEIDYIINNSHSMLLYEPEQQRHKFVDASRQFTYINENQLADLRSFPFQPIPELTEAEDPAFMLYTSGSTAKPKAVVHAHRVILGREPLRQHWLDLNAETILIHTGKPCWTYSMGVGLMDTWVKQGTALMYAGEESAEHWFELLERYQVTHFASSPAVYKDMLRLKNPGQYDLSHLRIAVSAGEVLPDTVKKYWMNHFSMPVYESLGMTEISTFISSGPDIPIKPEAIGQAQPGRNIRIVALEGNSDELPVGEEGLLAIHRDSPGLMLGYLGVKQDDPRYYRDDWFLTGDLLSRDAEGYLFHHGRADKVINVQGGYRISVAEIESTLLGLASVYNVACAGVPLDDACLLVAYIVLIDNKYPSPRRTASILDYIKKHLSPNKRPAKLLFVQQLPKTHTGKIDRVQLSELRPLKTVVCQYERL